MDLSSKIIPSSPTATGTSLLAFTGVILNRAIFGPRNSSSSSRAHQTPVKTPQQPVSPPDKKISPKKESLLSGSHSEESSNSENVASSSSQGQESLPKRNKSLFRTPKKTKRPQFTTRKKTSHLSPTSTLPLTAPYPLLSDSSPLLQSIRQNLSLPCLSLRFDFTAPPQVNTDLQIENYKEATIGGLYAHPLLLIHYLVQLGVLQVKDALSPQEWHDFSTQLTNPDFRFRDYDLFLKQIEKVLEKGPSADTLKNIILLGNICSKGGLNDHLMLSLLSYLQKQGVPYTLILSSPDAPFIYYALQCLENQNPSFEKDDFLSEEDKTQLRQWEKTLSQESSLRDQFKQIVRSAYLNPLNFIHLSEASSYPVLSTYGALDRQTFMDVTQEASLSPQLSLTEKIKELNHWFKKTVLKNPETFKTHAFPICQTNGSSFYPPLYRLISNKIDIHFVPSSLGQKESKSDLEFRNSHASPREAFTHEDKSFINPLPCTYNFYASGRNTVDLLKPSTRDAIQAFLRSIPSVPEDLSSDRKKILSFGLVSLFNLLNDLPKAVIENYALGQHYTMLVHFLRSHLNLVVLRKALQEREFLGEEEKLESLSPPEFVRTLSQFDEEKIESLLITSTKREPTYGFLGITKEVNQFCQDLQALLFFSNLSDTNTSANLQTFEQISLYHSLYGDFGSKREDKAKNPIGLRSVGLF